MKFTSFDLIKKVLVTTKTKKLMSAENKVAFEVDPRANKVMIKHAVEELWANVKVVKVATVSVPGRTKRLKRGLQVVVGAYKKAYVTMRNLDVADNTIKASVSTDKPAVV